MISAPEHPAAIRPAPARLPISPSTIAWAITLAAAWFWTCRHLALTWDGFSNYSFGHFVPWVALILAIRRITALPGCLNCGFPVTPQFRLRLAIAIFLAWALFLFAELIRQFDPRWRVVAWAMTASVTLLTICWLLIRGGPRLLRYMIFPLAFVWTAVPWPTELEVPLTTGLRALVTQATVAILHAMQIAASSQGNLINLAHGPDGQPVAVLIDSACSGINSLQSTIMVALLLGELCGLRLSRRIALLIGGCCIAMAGNLARSTTLLWIAHHGGIDLFHKFHDPAGYAETGLILATVVLLALIIQRRPNATSASLIAQAAQNKAPASEDNAAESNSTPSHHPAPGYRPGFAGFPVLAIFALIPFITTLWFRVSPGGPIREATTPIWTLKQSTQPGSPWRTQPVQLSAEDIATLQCTTQQTIALQRPGLAAVIYHFFWNTDSSTGFGHTPCNCMTGAGWQQIGPTLSQSLTAAPATFPCKLYRFQRGAQRVTVIQAVWYGGDPLLSDTEFPDTRDFPRAARLDLLWSAPRRRGIEALNIYLPSGPSTAAELNLANTVLSQVLAPSPRSPVSQ
jgi:exosortase